MIENEFQNDQYITQRLNKAELIIKDKALGGNPYASGVSRDCTNEEFLKRFAKLKEIALKDNTDNPYQNTVISLVGRIKFMRLMGKAAFIKIEDDSALLQVYLSQNELKEDFDYFKKLIEVGDIINVQGFPFVTKTGELSLHCLYLRILTKTIRPLPEKYHGLSDIELRYRQRYLDLMMNEEVRRSFQKRSRIIFSIRKFFEEKGFLEVETPMMHPIPGGANAKPFVTFHNALCVERYMRIAPELYLKRLIVGGFEAIFEINRNFRNEGIDHNHNPEFTSIEFYWAYKTYKDLMQLTRDLLDFLCFEFNLDTIEYDNHKINLRDIREISYLDALVEIGHVPREIINDKEHLTNLLMERNVPLAEHVLNDLGALQAEAFDNFVEKELINPTFIVDFPVSISPLARRSDSNPNIAERFELFIAGNEIANGFSELNDPLDQLERFKAQVAAKESGDEEAQFMDEDYINALSYGMPPTAGEGIGIDRLVMLLTGNRVIKDVILFPALKPQKQENAKSEPVIFNENNENADDDNSDNNDDNDNSNLKDMP